MTMIVFENVVRKLKLGRIVKSRYWRWRSWWPFNESFWLAVILRAAFKVRKLESLFYSINTYLQKTTTCIGLQAEHIFSKNTQYAYFFDFGHGFCRFLSMFQKLHLLVVKRIGTNFYCIVLLFVWAQEVCLRFLKSHFKLEMLIFLSFMLSFLVALFN